MQLLHSECKNSSRKPFFAFRVSLAIRRRRPAFRKTRRIQKDPPHSECVFSFDDDVGILVRAVLVEANITYADRSWRMCLSFPMPTDRKRDGQKALRNRLLRQTCMWLRSPA